MNKKAMMVVINFWIVTASALAWIGAFVYLTVYIHWTFLFFILGPVIVLYSWMIYSTAIEEQK